MADLQQDLSQLDDKPETASTTGNSSRKDSSENPPSNTSESEDATSTSNTMDPKHASTPKQGASSKFLREIDLFMY